MQVTHLSMVNIGMHTVITFIHTVSTYTAVMHEFITHVLQYKK